MNARGPRRTRQAPDTTPLRDLTGQVCVVTGASSGIGRAAAAQLARLGATVGLVGRDRRRRPSFETNWWQRSVR